MLAPLRLLFILLCFVTVLSGCSSSPSKAPPQLGEQITTEERHLLLSQFNEWKITGKIAFITPEERNSASLYWNKSIESQQLNISTYLGINVFLLTSNNNLHTIEVDGEEYSGTNLDNLITSLTGLTLPAQALTYWIKALPYLPSDKLTLSKNNVPTTLRSVYNGRLWAISYAAYKNLLIDKTYVKVPYKLTIKSDELTINIAIKKWTL